MNKSIYKIVLMCLFKTNIPVCNFQRQYSKSLKKLQTEISVLNKYIGTILQILLLIYQQCLSFLFYFLSQKCMVEMIFLNFEQILTKLILGEPNIASDVACNTFTLSVPLSTYQTLVSNRKFIVNYCFIYFRFRKSSYS